MAERLSIDRRYHRQVDLLLRLLPHVMAEKRFGLKGGTAINLFLRDMPRLSVDLDLTYLPLAPREESLRGIGAALERIAAAVGEALPGVRMVRQGSGVETKIVATEAGAIVKIEVNTIVRGALLPVRERELCEAAQDVFGRFVTARTVSDGELLGGKLVAALDRQHPRDLFDTRFVLERIGGRPDDELRLGFLLMILSHDRPPHEVLDPRERDPADAFARQFDGMARERFDLENHRQTFVALRAALPQLLPPLHREALLAAIERADAEPFAELAVRPEAGNLPAVRWKMQNLRRLRERDPAKHAEQVDALREVLRRL